MSQDAKYIFIISLFLIAVAYFAGTTRVFQTFGQQLVNLILVGSGRNLQGNFAPYPGNAPK